MPVTRRAPEEQRGAHARSANIADQEGDESRATAPRPGQRQGAHDDEPPAAEQAHGVDEI